MAEASLPGSVDVSDEVIEFPCSLCQDDGAVEEGVAYCTNCHDYLCRACLRVHRRIQASKDHKLLEGSKIREAVKYSSHAVTVHEICDKHKDKIVDYFCLSHSELLCQDCKDFSHRRCRDVKSIDDVSKCLHGSQQAQRFLDDTNALIRDLKGLQQSRAGSLRKVEQKKKTCQEDVKSLRKKIKSLFDRLEQEMQQNISQTSQQECTRLTGQLSVLSTAVKELEKNADALRDVTASGGDRQVFILMQKAELVKMKAVFEDLQHETGHGPLVFEMDGKVKDLLENLKVIGTVRVATVPVPSQMQLSPGGSAKGTTVVTGRRTRRNLEQKVNKTEGLTITFNSLPGTSVVKGVTPTCHVIPGSLSGWALVKTGTHPVKDKIGRYAGKCHVTGAKFLQDGRCILCDYSNRKLKLLDPGLCLQSSVEIPDRPWDIALLSEDEAVVTVPTQKKLQFVSVGREVNLGRTLTTDRSCYGIVVYNSHLYVTCQDVCGGNGDVVVLDLSGKCLRRLVVNHDFRNPGYIAVDGEGRVYVSDSGANTVTCLSSAGTTLYCYNNISLQSVQHLVVDSDSNVYVCGRYSNNVQVISREGRKLRTVLTDSDGLGYPVSLAYRSSDQTLVVGMIDDNILSFRFKEMGLFQQVAMQLVPVMRQFAKASTRLLVDNSTRLPNFDDPDQT